MAAAVAAGGDPPPQPMLERNSSALSGRRVAADVITGALQCAVCCDVTKSAATTPCGHTFCRACVEECLNLKHTCPVCNQDCTVDQLSRNIMVDSVVEALFGAAEEADEHYKATVFSAGGGDAAPSDGPVTIESLFAAHMGSTLVSFRNFQNRIDSDFAARLRSIESSGADAAEARRLSQRLTEQHRLAGELVLQEVENHLSAASMPPLLLPTTATVVMHRHAEGDGAADGAGGGGEGKTTALSPKELRFDMRIVGSTIPGEVLEAALKQFVGRGDEVTSTDGLRMILRPKVPVPGNDEDIHLALDSVEPIFRALPVGRLDGGTWMVFLEGEFMLKSDSQLCFSLEFDKGNPQSVDYFRCNTCAINWVCSRCATTCHKGHDVVDYIKQHTPTWACCYCAKKKAKTGCQLCAR